MSDTENPVPRLEALATAIDAARPIPLLAELVRIPSHPGLERQEEAVVAALERYLAERGLPASLVEVAAGRPNLLCTVRAPRPGPHLLLCGHTDTVPLNEGNPGVGFSAEIREGRMYGRGTVDMKGGVVAMAAALVALRETGMLPGGAVTLAAVVDEEMQSLGAEHLIGGGLKADGAIIGEPTSNRICLGHKGLEWLAIEIYGRAAHGGTPGAGINAILAAARFISRAERELVPRLASRPHPLLGPPTINFGTIRGGDQPSTVAARCTVTVDRRSLPGETYDAICAELREILASVEAEMPGLRTEIRRVPGGMATMEHVACVTAADAPLVLAATGAARAVRGSAGELGAFPAWTDGALLAAFGGVPCLILGPGDPAVAHAPIESVSIDEVRSAALLYAMTALHFCGGEQA